MKKLKLFFACLLVSILSIGQMWATEKSFTITFKANGGSQDGSAALTASNFMGQVTESADSILSVAPTACYSGVEALKVSANKTNGYFTLTLAHPLSITKVVLNVKNKNATVKTVSVGSTSFSTSDNWNTTSFTDLEFTGTETESNQITVNLNGTANSYRVAYLHSMTIYHNVSEGGTPQPTVSVDPEELSFGPVGVGDDAPTGQSFTITGSYLTEALTVNLSNGAQYNKSVLGSLTPNGDGEVSATVTITPQDGITASAETKEATVTISGGGLEEDVEVALSTEVKAKHAINFYIDGGSVDPTSVDVMEGATYSDFPTVTGLTNCEYGTFEFWTSATSISNGAKPAEVEEVTMSTSDVNLYAVYSKTVGGSGSNGSIEITRTTTNFPTGYGSSNTFTEYSLNGYKFKIQQVYNNNAASGTGSKTMQWRASGHSNGTGTIYNTDTYPAHISSIVLVYANDDSNKNHTLKVGDSENPTSGTSITPTSDGNTYTFDCSKEEADYFVLTNGSGAGYLSSFTINYGTASVTTYSLDANCCTQQDPIAGMVSTSTPPTFENGTVEWTIPVDGSSNKKAAGVILHLYADNNNAKGEEIIAKKADYSSDNNTTSHTFTELAPETKYWFTIELIGKEAGGVKYCDTEEGTPVSFTTAAASYTWTITYNANGENVTNMPDATYAQKSTGEGTLSSTVPVRAGYTFLGWDKVDDASDATYAAGAAITDVDDDLDLYAIWERRDVTLVVGSGSVTSSTLVPDGEGKVLLPSATPSEACTTLNWKFIGWAEAEATGTKPATIIPAGEYTPVAKKSLYAVYGELGNTYTKITSGSDFTTGNYVFAILSGKALNNTISTKTTAGTTVTISNNSITNPDAAAIWLVTKSGDNYTLYNAATEGANKYLNIIADGNYGQLASESIGANYTAEFTNSGDILLKSATISGQLIEYYGPSSIFQCWGSANTAIYAFKQDYSSYETTPNCVTYTLSSEVDTDNTDETSSVSIVKSVLKEAEETKATATPKDGYRFLHWTISGTGAAMSNTADGMSTDNPVTVTMGTANATITAYFEKIPSHKVYFYNGTTLLNGENGTDVLEGGAVAYSGATPESCDEGEGASLTFAGWTTAKWTGKIAKNAITVNTFYEGELPEMGEDDVTYYAVFCKNNEASALFEWEGGSSAGLTAAGATISGNDTDYKDHSPYYVKLDGTGDYIQILTSAAIGSVAIGVKMVGGGNTSSITVQESTNGSNFTDVQTLTISGSQNDILNLSTTNAFASTSRVVRLYFTKGSNIGVGPITVMGVAPANSNYMTTCLLDLGGISGTAGLSQLTEGENKGKLQASWDEQTDQTGWADEGLIIKIYKDGETPTLVHTSVAQDQDKEGRSYVWGTAPDYCSEYYATLTPVKKDNSYKDGVEQGKSASNCAISGQYSYHVTLVGMQLKDGQTEAASNCSDFAAIYETTGTNQLDLTEVTVTNAGTSGNGWTWNASTGALTIDKTKVTGNVEITLTGNVPSDPIVTVEPSSWDFGTPQINGSVDPKDFVLTGSNLTKALSVAMPNNGAFSYTTKSGSLTPDVNGDVAATITVTPSTVSAGDKGGNIVVSGDDLDEAVNVALSLNVLPVYTVNWWINGGENPAATQTGVVGATMTIPNNFSAFTDCSDFTFVGWKEGAIEGGSTTIEPILADVGTTIPEADKNYYAVFAEGTPASTETIFNESLASGISTTGWTFNNKCYTLNSAVRLSTGDDPGVMTSPALSSLTGTATLSFEVKAWSSTENGKIDISASKGTFATTSFTTSSSDDFEEVSTTLSGGDNTTTITFTGTKSKRISIKNVKVTQEVAPAYSKWYTSCPHITSVALEAGSAEHGSISFEKGGLAVTSVRTDGGDAVEVDVIASIDEGYELTGLTLTSEDVTGATKNEALTKITIPAGEEGTLTVTPTITLIPKYSITFANGGADGGSDPTPMADQYAGETITLPANAYTYTGHKFDKWKVTYGETELDKAVGETFEMPAANVTITAQWLEILTAKISFMVGGEEKASINKEQEVEFTIDQDGSAWAPTGFTFVGWATEEQAEETEVAPTTITKYTPQAGVPEVMLYGIYSRHEDSGNQHYVLDYTDDGVKDMTLGYGNAVDVTATDGSQWVVKAFKSNGMQINKSSNGSIKVPNCPGNIVSIAVTGNSSKAIGFSESDYSGSGTITYVVQGTDATLQNLSFAGKTVTAGYIVPVSNANQITHIDVEFDASKNYYTSSPVEKVTVTFALAGGEGGCQTMKINKGSELTICDAVPTKLHSEFAGWKNGDDVYVAGTAYTFDADITLTAQWNEAAKYTVTYAKGGDDVTGSVPTDNNKYFAGEQVTVLGQGGLEKSGYEFQGWLNGNKLYVENDVFVMPADDVALVAQWKKKNIDEVVKENMMLITDANGLVDGMAIALGCSYGESNFAMAGDIPATKKYLASVSGDNITLNNGLATFTSDVITMIAEQVEGGWKLRKDETNYLTITGTDVKWDTQANATAWTISFSNGNVQIASGNNKIQFNTQDPRFKTYTNQTPIQLFGKAIVVAPQDNATEPVEVNISDLGYVEEGQNIVASGDITLTIDVPTEAQSITAKDGATIVIEEETTAKDVVVEDGSKIVAEAETHTPVVHFATTLGSSQTPSTGSAIGEAQNIILHAGGEIHYDITLGTSMAGVQADPNQWHAFTVPFTCDALNGIYNAETGAKLTNEVDYAIMDYHGDIRANGQYGWKKFRGTLVPGTFYIMTVNGDVKTFRFKKVATGALPNNTSKDFTAYGVTDPNNTTPDQGWNGIGNPSWVSVTLEYPVQVLDPYSYEYQTLTAGTVISASTPFFYKANATSTMTMSESNANAQYAPRRTPANEIKNLAVSFGNEVFRDKLYISASEDALSTYENDKDLVKMTMSNTPKVAQIFGKAYNTKLCMVYAPLSNDQAVYDLTLYAPQAGEYTIAAPSMDNADLYLTYEGSIIWNLSMNEYVADFAKGNNEGYGLLLVRKAPNAATGVDEVTGDKVQCTKVVIDDHVYILRGKQLYGIDGKMVK